MDLQRIKNTSITRGFRVQVRVVLNETLLLVYQPFKVEEYGGVISHFSL